MEKEKIEVGDKVWVYRSFNLVEVKITSVYHSKLNSCNIIEYEFVKHKLFELPTKIIETETEFRKRIA